LAYVLTHPTSYLKIELLSRLGYVSQSARRKPGLDLDVITMTGRFYLWQAVPSLVSLCHAWEGIPRLTVYSDGSMAVDRLRKFFTWWPGQLSVKSWRDALEYHHERRRQELDQEVELQQGLAEKLMIILAEAERRPVLWLDGDILWFKQLPGVMELQEQFRGSSEPVCRLAQDLQPYYDDPLVAACMPELKDPPYRNSGVCFANGNLFDKYDPGRFLSATSASSQQPRAREQTLLAYLGRTIGNDIWTYHQIGFPGVGESLSSIQASDFCAAHYISPRREKFPPHAVKLWVTNVFGRS
jgi:hypothetical protein